MSRLWDLDSFDTADPVSSPAAQPVEALTEDERLQAFDAGYKDGWDDAARAHAEDQNRISVELAGHLQEMSFTYHEARNAVLGEMEGILKGMVSSILPRTMEHSLGQMIVERALEASATAADIAFEVVVSPANTARVRTLLEGMIAPPLEVVAEPTLGEGQAFLRLGHSEQKIDLEAVLQGLSEAVDEFFETPENLEARHG
ncbi:ABC transporter ATP-binding protein [Tropicimonas sp. IMCC6043]|uniref:FliH/SctL family protein n=1 Tax=Tropicimonas sp. IMCC6043 TaxID=2510645 RepID=UPI00101CBF1B|nr:ABC transporter ATP-binding protein [Tropicimonas sp. IMCC6043]RYH10118.1 ABC transporter ATP-binding protein [Tropicimonas sp. IMCC6043]